MIVGEDVLAALAWPWRWVDQAEAIAAELDDRLLLELELCLAERAAANANLDVIGVTTRLGCRSTHQRLGNARSGNRLLQRRPNVWCCRRWPILRRR